MSDALLQVENLTIGYRSRRGEIVHVLRSVSLEMRAGETLGLVGESGCGKSTLVQAVLGHLRSGSQVLHGQVLFEDIDVFALPAGQLQQLRGRRIAMIPQNAGQALTPTMKIGPQLVEALMLHSDLSPAAMEARAIELLAQVRLPQPEEMIRRYPHQLSGGQQQRVAIAMALAGSPELLLLDEPTTGLDVTTQARILELLNELCRASGAALLYVSHDLGVIARVCDRVAVMYAGEIIEDAPVDRLFNQPTHPYSRGLLASIPRLGDARIPGAMPGQPPGPGQHSEGCAFAPRCSFADDSCRLVHPRLELVEPGIGTAHRARCQYWHRVQASPWSDELKRAFHSLAREISGETALALDDVAISYARRNFADWLRRRPAQDPAAATVSGISLEVQRGETLALVGESGSGKSTLIRTVAGLRPPINGRIMAGDFDLTQAVDQRPRDLQRRIQLIFQNPDASLNPRHTVRQIIEQPLRLYFDLSAAERLERIKALLERVRLGVHYLERFPGQLSGGEKQRVAIARAFAAEPDIVLCDEVTSALDVSVQAAVLDLLATLQAERQVAYLYISHDLAVVRAIADRVAVLYQGRLCEIGSVNQIYTPPFHPYTETLLSAVLEPDPAQQHVLIGSDVVEAQPPERGCPFQRRCPRHRGPICDEEAPPWQTAGTGHQIRCHIPLEELAALEAATEK